MVDAGGESAETVVPDAVNQPAIRKILKIGFIFYYRYFPENSWEWKSWLRGLYKTFIGNRSLFLLIPNSNGMDALSGFFIKTKLIPLECKRLVLVWGRVQVETGKIPVNSPTRKADLITKERFL